MKKKPFSLEAKAGICVLLFAFLLFPMSPNIALAAEEAVAGDTAGAKVAQAESGAGAGGAAAGEVAAGASTGLSAATIAAIAVGVAVVVIGIAAVIGSGGDDDGSTVTH